MAGMKKGARRATLEVRPAYKSRSWFGAETARVENAAGDAFSGRTDSAGQEVSTGVGVQSTFSGHQPALLAPMLQRLDTLERQFAELTAEIGRRPRLTRI